MPLTRRIVEEIFAERKRQIEIKRGGDTNAFDRENTKNDWVSFITCYAGRADDRCSRTEGLDFRDEMVKVAALAVAAIEAYDNGWC
jgi:hypothetical protein